MSITWKTLYEECERKGYYVPHSTKEKCYLTIKSKMNRIMYDGYALDDYNTDWTYKPKPLKTADLTEQARKLGFIIPIRKEDIQLYNKMKAQLHHIMNGKFTLDDLNPDWSKKKRVVRRDVKKAPTRCCIKKSNIVKYSSILKELGFIVPDRHTEPKKHKRMARVLCALNKMNLTEEQQREYLNRYDQRTWFKIRCDDEEKPPPYEKPKRKKKRGVKLVVVEQNKCFECKKKLTFRRTINHFDYCLRCAPKHEKPIVV